MSTAWLTRLPVLIGVCFFLLSGCTSGRSTFEPGSTPPQLKVTTLDGVPFDLASLRGKVVVLNFWATWCGPCVSELPALEHLYQRLKERDLVVVAVAVDDDIENLKKFKESYGLSFPVLVDQAGTAKADFKLTGVPETLFLDREGKLVLMMDPETDQASTRMLGPRQWDEPQAFNRVAALLPK